MRFRGTCYRAHDPQWSFQPLSGGGAAIRGARFNAKGMPTLYLSLTVMTAIKEANQGLAHRIDPCVLCSYAVDCQDIVDLRSPEGRAAASVKFEDMACAWLSEVARGRRPSSWSIQNRLIKEGAAGILVPSFAPGAAYTDQNLVLWDWSEAPPHQVQVIDPKGRLPRNPKSWTNP